MIHTHASISFLSSIFLCYGMEIFIFLRNFFFLVFVITTRHHHHLFTIYWFWSDLFYDWRSFKGSKDAGLNQRRTRYKDNHFIFILHTYTLVLLYLILFWWRLVLIIIFLWLFLHFFLLFFISLSFVLHFRALHIVLPAFIYFVVHLFLMWMWNRKKNWKWHKKYTFVSHVHWGLWTFNILVCCCAYCSRISPMRDVQTPERDRLPHYGPRFSTPR